ncbi:hypothetical protein ACQUQP_07075 [Marinobacterium sp. YM272]|uniref:hypothetical protein n=1 Tax=Marinobacterium sp. YM272 TaxID=3421654 RepID=UPI003D7F5688
MDSVKLRHLLSEKISTLDNEQVAYLLSVAFLLLVPLIAKFSDFPAYWLSFGACICGLALYVIDLAETFTNNIFGKSIASVFIVGCTTFNLGMAHAFVNGALEAPVSPFGYTITLSAILSIPYTAALFLAFTFAFWMLLLILVSCLSLNKFSLKKLLSLSHVKELFANNPITLFGRVFSAIVLFSVSLNFLQNNEGYMNATSDFIRWFAYSFEMEMYSYCDVSADQKVAYLSGNKIVLATEKEDSYTFTVGDCEVDL